MMRIQIQVERDQHRRLRRRARLLGVSISEIVRRSIASELDRDAENEWGERVRRAKAVVGRFRDPSGETDIALRHDAALADAFRS
jgi:post-segregation antitoxin (ccd killing protein)